jgi:hypothetical protein
MQSVPHNNLPHEVVRVLATHGEVEVITGGSDAGGRVACAPFEDIVYLFVSKDSAIERGLLKVSRLSLSATAPDGSYAIRMSGRAHAGTEVGRHTIRGVLEPWVPDGVPIGRLLAVPFVAEEVEFIRGRGDEAVRHAGPTPAGKERPTELSIWIRTAFSGIAGVLAVLFTLIVVGWFVRQGAGFLGRPLALLFSLVAGLGLISGSRLFLVAWGYELWRVHRAVPSDAPWLVGGFMAPGEARMTGATALLSAMVALVPLAVIWGSELVTGVVLLSGVWLAGPAGVIHLAMGRPDPQR